MNQSEAPVSDEVIRVNGRKKKVQTEGSSRSVVILKISPKPTQFRVNRDLRLPVDEQTFS